MTTAPELHSRVAVETIEAYRQTHYHVTGELPATLIIGQRSEALARIHQAYAVTCSAFITPCNPYGEILTDQANADRYAACGEALVREGHRYVMGVGQHPSNEWPGEASYLILGVDLIGATRLGQRYEQNAIVWTGEDRVPTLILLR
jgi:Protein of unknown function (DUF3293)